MLVNELRVVLKPFHDEIEQYAYSDKIMATTITPEEYKHLLKKQYITHKPIEEALDKHKDELAKIGYIYRSKMDSIRKDLIKLDENPDEIKIDETFELNSKNEALGCLYVIEGSTMGGAMIANQLPKSEALKDSLTLNYYGIYGDKTREYFLELAEIINSNSKIRKDADEITEACKKTYRFMIDLFKKY